MIGGSLMIAIVAVAVSGCSGGISHTLVPCSKSSWYPVIHSELQNATEGSMAFREKDCFADGGGEFEATVAGISPDSPEQEAFFARLKTQGWGPTKSNGCLSKPVDGIKTYVEWLDGEKSKFMIDVSSDDPGMCDYDPNATAHQ